MAVAVTPPERTPDIDAAFNGAVLSSIKRLEQVVTLAAPGDAYIDQVATNFVNFAFTGPPPETESDD